MLSNLCQAFVLFYPSYRDAQLTAFSVVLLLLPPMAPKHLMIE